MNASIVLKHLRPQQEGVYLIFTDRDQRAPWTHVASCSSPGQVLKVSASVAGSDAVLGKVQGQVGLLALLGCEGRGRRKEVDFEGRETLVWNPSPNPTHTHLAHLCLVDQSQVLHPQ
jgi:hypothetical protein